MALIFRKLRTARLFLTILLILYTIFSDNGRIAVRDETTGAVWRTDVSCATLPQSDQLLLERGIVCEDRLSLAAAIENFIS